MDSASRHTNRAGPALVAALRHGEAVRIATGAPVPAGSTLVIRDRYIIATTIADNPAIARRPGTPLRDDTRRRGENWPAGAQLAPTGQRVSLPLVSAALSAETPTAQIRGPLRAQLILTGDEIRSTGHLAIGQTPTEV
jgi:molybdopterin molybdotransferase